MGRRVVAELRRHGHDVFAASRRGGDGTTAIGDMTCITDWTPLTHSCDAVVHLAAMAHRLGREQPSEAMYMLANAAVPERIAMSLRRSRARLVFVSSVGAICQSSVSTVSDTMPAAPTTPYGRSKLEAESRVSRVLSEGTADFVILRPPLMYGEGNPGNMARLVNAIRTGRPIPHDSDYSRRSLMYVDNFSSAVATAIVHPAISRCRHLVCDGERLTFREIVNRIAAARGVAPRLLPVPHGLLRLARCVSALTGAAGIGAASRLAEMLDRLTTSLVVDDSPFRRITGWTPPTDGPAAFLRSFRP